MLGVEVDLRVIRVAGHLWGPSFAHLQRTLQITELRSALSLYYTCALEDKMCGLTLVCVAT